MAEISENRRTEYASLREEIYRSDRTCFMLMGFLVSMTGAVGGTAFGVGLCTPVANFAFWFLSPIWVLGFWYFTEKRFVIIRIASYIRDQIEAKEEGLGWEQFGRELSRKDDYRRAIPLDPYHLEVVSCSLVLVCIPAVGRWLMHWNYAGFYFVTSVLLFMLFFVLAVRAWREYGRPQEYTLDSDKN